MQNTTIERNMINIIELIDFQTVEELIAELEVVSMQIDKILKRKYKMKGCI